MRFKIGAAELEKRSKYIKYGAFFTLILVVFIYYHNSHYPEQYNDVLLWSLMFFAILTNLVGYYRYRRYCNLAKEHWVEVHEKQLNFYSKGEESQLNIDDIAALKAYRKKGDIQHIQIKLKNNRGIRLEGYEDIDALMGMLSERVPKAHIMDN